MNGFGHVQRTASGSGRESQHAFSRVPSVEMPRSQLIGVMG